MIDWNKPIETRYGHPAELVRELRGALYKYLIVVSKPEGDLVYTSNSTGVTIEQDIVGQFIRNKQDTFRLYGDPCYSNVRPWTRDKTIYDTHVIELTEDDLKQVMRKL